MRGFDGKRLTGAAFLVATLAACASVPVVIPSSSPADGSEPRVPSDSTYGRLFQTVRDNGGVATKEVALQAFSLAIAPLPGVDLPGGEPAQDFERADGTFAVDWLEPYLSELTPEQRRVYDNALAPDPKAPRHTPETAATTSLAVFNSIFDSVEYKGYETQLEEAEALIAAKLHRKLRLSWSLSLADVQHDTEHTLALTTLAFAATRTGYECHFSVEPWLRDQHSALVAQATMAHEMFHCFQYDLLGGKQAVPWMMEGQAEWVGENLKGPSVVGKGWWSTYLKSPWQPLFKRDYDAYGYYMHMEVAGLDPWTVLDAMLLEGESVAAFKKAGTTGAAFLDTWASGFMRDRTLGTAWIEDVPWPTQQHGDAQVVEVPATGSVAVEAAALTISNTKFVSSADIVESAVVGHTRLSVAGVDSVGLDGRWLCTKIGGCVCPAGQFYGGPPFEAAGPVFNVAVTGSLDGVAGSLIGHSMVEFCQDQPLPSPTSSGGGGSSTPPCPRGCAGSMGEPHLRTVDNVAYDVQAAGEYILLRSVDGAVEIQARQEPRGTQPASNISINTAVAARVNGHRVSVRVPDVAGDPLDVMLDGETATLDSPLDLGSGTSVVRYANGVEIDLADGTKLYAVAMRSSCCLNIVIAPSDTLRAAGVGLLGNVAAGVLPVPALPDGTRLPRVDNAHDRFSSIYNVLVPAWLVTDATTLFDYDAGKTTASYLVADFPIEAQTRTVEDLTPGERQTAAATCSAVTDADLLLECMFDVTVSDLEDWATLYDLTDNFVAGGTDILETAAPDPDALPAGIIQLLPAVSAVQAGAIASSGVAYVTAQESAGKSVVVAVDLATGSVLSQVTATSAGSVAVGGGSVWVGDLNKTDGCSVTKLDAVSLAVRGTVTVPCDFVGAVFVWFDGAVWFLDRTTADADAHGGRLRRIDPQTLQVSGDVVVPFANGRLIASDGALFWLAQASLGDVAADHALYRLLPGETALTSFGPAPDNAIFPAAEGYWTTSQYGGPALYRASPEDPGSPLVVDGQLVGADESAVYVAKNSSFDGTPELWRHPVDGSAPDKLALGVTLQTENGDQTLAYLDNSPLMFSAGYAVKLWLVPASTDHQHNPLVMQVTPLP
jgi:hypothetical protein